MAHSTLRTLIQSELPSLLALRHDLHRNPELSMQERRTSEVIQKELKAAGLAIKAGLGGGTGVLGHLHATTGGKDDGTVALRADIDALPIVERTGKAYASSTPGVMHACGHDGHTSILIGAARVLAKMDRPRPVLFLFQPAEEDGGGAERMCQEGCLAGEKGGGLGPAPASRIYGLHGWPTLEVGKVASKPGPMMASTDDFVVTVKGVQCHGAYPHAGRDAILASAHIITALQLIASRSASPLDSVVCTVGQINAGTANNIIPETCTLIGTVRALRPAVRTLAKQRFFEIVEHTARAHGCEARIQWNEGYPVTENDAELTEKWLSVARTTLGADRVQLVDQATMGGEDFAYYGRHAKACFYFLGLRPRNAETYPTLHQPDFDFNDDALATGVELMCELALRG
jgi:hippurate hydrolase